MSDPNTLSTDNAAIDKRPLIPAVEVDFDTKNCTLLLRLGGKELVAPDLLTKLEEKNFQPKDELHVTAINFKNGGKIAKKLKKMDPGVREGILKKLSESVADQQWEITPTDEMYGLEKQYEGGEIPRGSVIQMVDCPQLTQLYDEFNALFPELELEVPPAHITLATQGNPQGIAVSTLSELQQIGTKLT